MNNKTVAEEGLAFRVKELDEAQRQLIGADWQWEDYRGVLYGFVPNFLYSWEAAKLVIKRLAAAGFSCEVRLWGGEEVEVVFEDTKGNSTGWVVDETFPKAVSRAALLTVEVYPGVFL